MKPRLLLRYHNCKFLWVHLYAPFYENTFRTIDQCCDYIRAKEQAIDLINITRTKKKYNLSAGDHMIRGSHIYRIINDVYVRLVL